MVFSLHGTNDTFYDQQWAINNTGQSGGTADADMDVTEAWNITTGCSLIRIAILDSGVDLTHPDLNDNLATGFDATGAGGSGEAVGSDFHGTCCAGIAAAEGNNSLGIAGIAYNSQIVSVKVLTDATPVDDISFPGWLATGIDWAWQNNRSDIISMSLGIFNSSQLVTDAINRAVSQGRNNLGCTVLAISHNDGTTSLRFPARLNNVLAVGATDRHDNRASFSNYGIGLDVVAPGVEIYTTDRQGSIGYNTSSGTSGDYFANFGGTSAACPNVAGVAALILSVNPGLTQEQVRNIIESTTDKPANYTYTLGAGEQPNLTWNNQMGYGRVNALKAVQAVFPFISGPSVVCSSESTFTINNYPSGSTVSWSKSSNLNYVSGQNTNSYVVQSGSIGNAWVQATIITSCDTIELPAYSLWSGVPVIESTETLAIYPNGWNNVCVFQQKVVGMNITGESSVVWEKLSSTPYNISWYQNGNNLSFYFYDINQNAVFRVSASNSCGSTSYSYGFMAMQCGGDPCDPEYLISPNPASGMITIVPDIPPPCDEYLMLSNQITQVKVYDSNGSIKKSFRYGKGTNRVEINTSDLRTGTYFLEISNGIKSVRKIMIIRH
ncbi:MAG TPA: S8 family serine peptidase [Bacteroidales bacterium]|nr:S8 family serine peptidase [Bacteroidales bacterium]